ncbi:Ctr copper transporter [Penicillium tannophilum]|uniref:Copper transport protein n=1 Tax=Penicillium frequentans TaxID=3151616 RepID=A0AAD6GGT8_9EURO|nr:Ctr copper transporter [Penicillium pulvis]KAJ5546357.1 Ctr copper transporter [Penicillium glabrum]KAJ5802896.1 Ctr copper transporter [Penicillium pulvis]KAJ5897945.1 Ctr copper transporter [Penicillium tannophilum]
MDMSTATTTSSSMTMSSTSSSDMSMSDMAFNTNNLSAILFSQSWMPTTTAGYVGSWFFLFFLTVIWRASAAMLSKLDVFWAAKNARYSILINGGQDQPTQTDLVTAWRLSVNLPRAALRMVHQGIAYLLMIAVMTMNVGFFFAVLVGYFFGELVFGRVSRSD